MLKITKNTLVGLLSLLLAGQAGANLGNVTSGDADFIARGCNAVAPCHGSPTNDYHLRGASLKQLTKVKSGDVPHTGQTAVFIGISDQGLRNLAAYLSSLNTTFEVKGSIDAQGTPVEKVNVSISNDYLPEANANQLVQTGSLQGKKGIFVIPGLPAGDYTIDPSDPDYYFNPGSISVEITNQGGIDCQQQTFPAAQPNLAGCDFDATATAVGLALYQGGSNPNDNVDPNCSFCHLNNPAQDTNGRILNGARLSILEELRNNDHEANAQPNGANWAAFTDADLPVLAAFLSSQDSKKYTIEGTILDANNLPNPLNDSNIAVALTNSYGLPEVQAEKPTGGTFAFDNLPPGDYDVTPKRTGYDFSPTQREVAVAYRGVWLDRSQTNASATNTTALDSVDFEGGLAPQFAAGKALVDTSCSTALCHGPDPQSESPVSSANTFGFNRILYGATRATLYPCDDPSKPIEECTCVDPLSCTQEMKVVMAALTETERDQIASYLSIAHHTPFTLEGKVEIAGASQPKAVIPGATVEISANLYDQTRTTTTNESGEYRIEGLWWGEQTITVTKPGYDLVKAPGQLGDIFAMPSPSWPNDVSVAEAVAMRTDGTPPVIAREYEATFNIDTSGTGPGAVRYAARCANCHGATPNAKARIGARLSVLRAIQIASHGRRSSAPIEEDWTAPAYGTVHDQTGPNAPINAPLPFYGLTDLELQETASWLATFEEGSYRTSGTIFPAYLNTDVEALHVNLYSDTGPSYVVLTDASGDYVIPEQNPPPSGFAPGDYLITLPGSNASPDYKKIHFGNEFLCIRQELCYLTTGPVFPSLPNVDFNLSSPLIISEFMADKIYDMMEAAGSGGQDGQNMESHICFDDPDFDPYAFMNSLQDDHGNLSEITSSIFLAGPAVWNLSGTELEVPVAWDRTARILTTEPTGAPGPAVNWTVEGGSTTLRMRYNQDAGTLTYCGESGDRMLALTGDDDVLRITTGSLDGMPVFTEATIQNGVYTPPAIPLPGLATWGLLVGAAALALAGRRRLRRR